MSAVKDLTGQFFGKLTVLERAENDKHGKARWLCQCECGNTCVVQRAHLANGHTKSCGCLERESPNHTIHGLSNDRTYEIWSGIKKRCFNSNNKEYKNYGARGITLYAPWINDFQAFYDYVSQLEHFGEEGYTLDRKDTNGNYEPCNVRWATQKEQQRNRRNNIIIEYNGTKMTLAEAAEKSGIKYGTLLWRYYHGDRGERLFRPVKS